MPSNFGEIAVVILAAGLGKRMKSNKLKVMHELKGRPLIDYAVRAVEQSGLGVKPIVVVADDNNSVQEYLGDRAQYVVQAERIGTGHAVAQAESVLKDQAKAVVVLYGDMPFIKPTSLSALAAKHFEKGNQVTLMTAQVDSFTGVLSALADYGRVLRAGEQNFIVGIVEKKDATPTELEIKEVNSGFYCFDGAWLWPHLKKMKNNNNQGEYYLTDLVAQAVDEGSNISSVAIDSREAVGVNTSEQLSTADSLLMI